MATIRIHASELRAGDVHRYDGGSHTFLKVWKATPAEARLWKADGMQVGDICVTVRWLDGGTSDRFYAPHHWMTVERPDPAE